MRNAIAAVCLFYLFLSIPLQAAENEYDDTKKFPIFTYVNYIHMADQTIGNTNTTVGYSAYAAGLSWNFLFLDIDH